MIFTKEQLSSLTPGERRALEIASACNQSTPVRALLQGVSKTVGRRWMTLVSQRRMNLVGIEKMSRLHPDRGVLIAANHRSLFDQYMILTYLHRRVDYCRRFFFPVRSTFFYEHLLGVALNAAVSQLAMYPPIFRAAEKREVTRAGLDFLARELGRPGTIVGIHPEGTRGKGPDPYELLPAEQSFGRVVLSAKPIVIPIFVNGMTNDLLAESRSTFDGSGVPILIVFGDPLDLSDFAGADPSRLRSQIEVGRRALQKIAELGEVERRVRAELGRGAPLAQVIAGLGPPWSDL